MKGRSRIKIDLSIIFTFILTLVMVAVSPTIASAAQISDVQTNPVETECGAQKAEMLENLIAQGVQTGAISQELHQGQIDCKYKNSDCSKVCNPADPEDASKCKYRKSPGGVCTKCQ